MCDWYDLIKLRHKSHYQLDSLIWQIGLLAKHTEP